MRPARPERPLRHGVAFVAVTPEREVLLRRRPLKGLLGGMVEVPCSEWRGEPWSAAEARQAAPLAARWRTLAPAVEHGFTHFRLELTVKVAEVRQRPVAAGFWWPIADLHRQPLPTVIKKVLRAGFQYGE